MEDPAICVLMEYIRGRDDDAVKARQSGSSLSASLSVWLPVGSCTVATRSKDREREARTGSHQQAGRQVKCGEEEERKGM